MDISSYLQCLLI